VLVEGYFDVLACHRAGVGNVVAVSGTALTEQHVGIIKRYAETVVLCLDQDRAGMEAAERAFQLCAKGAIHVRAVKLPGKDPDAVALEDPEGLRRILESGGEPYLDLILAEVSAGDCTGIEGKRRVSQRLLPLLRVLPSALEQEHYLGKLAALLCTTETALGEDLRRIPDLPPPPKESGAPSGTPAGEGASKQGAFSRAEIVLGLILLFPQHRGLLAELIEPEEGTAAALHRALRSRGDGEDLSGGLDLLSGEERERVGILQLFCEHHGFAEWSESLALQEIRRNCAAANREFLQRKQQEIARRLLEAHRSGKATEEAQLQTQYQQVLKLSRMVPH
jgi:DNA primase